MRKYVSGTIKNWLPGRRYLTLAKDVVLYLSLRQEAVRLGLLPTLYDTLLAGSFGLLIVLSWLSRE